MRQSVIWDFALQVTPDGELIMAPEGTQWLKVVVKGDVPHLYGVVNPDAPLVPWIFKTICAGQRVETDNDFTRSLQHIDSFLIGDWFVGHLFLHTPGAPVKVHERYEDDFKEVGHR